MSQFILASKFINVESKEERTKDTSLVMGLTSGVKVSMLTQRVQIFREYCNQLSRRSLMPLAESMTNSFWAAYLIECLGKITVNSDQD